jgi:hypothetical protein
MSIAIQSRSFKETDWSDELWRRTHFEAYVVAKTKAELTGQIYRLVNEACEVLEEVRHLYSGFGRGGDRSCCPLGSGVSGTTRKGCH